MGDPKKAQEIAQNASALLIEMGELLKLKGENPFKVRAFEQGAQVVSGQVDLVEKAKAGRLTDLPGIGKGISDILTEFCIEGVSRARDDLIRSLPKGLLEFSKVPGLGPKKAAQLIEELDIHTLGELEYACRENRLLKLKGFGEKVQKNILNGVLFLCGTEGVKRWVDVLPFAEKAQSLLEQVVNAHKRPVATRLRVEVTGPFRRKIEVIKNLEFLVEMPSDKKTSSKLRQKFLCELDRLCEKEILKLPCELHESTPDCFGYDLAKTTASEEHWKALGQPEPFLARDEEEFYQKLKLPWIAPEMRELGDEVRLAKQGELKNLLAPDAIQGVFHVHTNRSDGIGTLEEMVQSARDAGFKFVGISDHSQSAYYANGLKPMALKAQEKEIFNLQKKHKDIRIFWGIESDILGDGSLDYDAKTLERFDFVIASIHSRFKMDKKEMTERILKAIQNPFTTMVGHVSGRLLLGRAGYEIDFETIIAEAARHNVAIEINAHPARLDIDWRNGPWLRKYGTKVSVNPDAHTPQGIHDTAFGVTVARKALLPQKQVLNSWSLKEVEEWLSQRK